MLLNRKYKYLQIAFNRSLHETRNMIARLPSSERIIIEAGTPFIKEYGQAGLARIARAWRQKTGKNAYIVADAKCMDRGATEVKTMADAGASAVTCLGLAPTETIDEFIRHCMETGVDSMIDMLNIQFPFEVLGKLKKQPDIVVLHRGVDESDDSKKPIPFHDINRIKSAYSTFISIAGGETSKETSRAFFNGADIAVVWRAFFENPENTAELAEKFLKSIPGYDKTRKK